MVLRYSKDAAEQLIQNLSRFEDNIMDNVEYIGDQEEQPSWQDHKKSEFSGCLDDIMDNLAESYNAIGEYREYITELKQKLED